MEMPGADMAMPRPRFGSSEAGEAIPGRGVEMCGVRISTFTARLEIPGPGILAAPLGIGIPGPGIAKAMTGTGDQQQVH